MTLAEFVYTVLLKLPPLRRAANAAIRALLPERCASAKPPSGSIRTIP